MKELVESLYWAGTDFCINLANLFGISYVEFNMLLFVILFPATTAILILLNVYKYIFLREKVQG